MLQNSAFKLNEMVLALQDPFNTLEMGISAS